ncbi:MAG: hypothetical protein PHP98_02030 [Kiritimatiellae bacterium]|nr:hypothetical protein [Kiritimatiellia bacterium]
MNTWRWIMLGIIALLSVFVAASLPGEPAHGYWWDRIPAFYIFYGFAGCVLIIVFAKTLGKLFLQRKEDYYDDVD